MDKDRFRQLVAEALDQLPQIFGERIDNVIIVVEDLPAPGTDTGNDLLMGIYEGIPTTEESVWDMSLPDRIVLYQDNIEAVCETDDEVREEIRLTVLHELGHQFGMDEEQLKDV